MGRERGSGRRRRGIVAAAITAALAFLVGPAPSDAGAMASIAPSATSRAVVEHNPLGRFLGVVPTNTTLRSLGSANGTPPLTYHNGPVQHSSTAYAIFWSPKGYTLPSPYRAAVSQYFSDVAINSYGVGNVYAASTQYYDLTGPNGSKAWVSYDVRSGGTSTVHDPLPANGCPNYRLPEATATACLTDGQLQHEITNVIAARRWPRGLGSEFFLFTPPGIGICFSAGGDCYGTSSGGFCAYHSWVSGTEPVLYAAQPYAAIEGCEYSTTHGPRPNGDVADAVLNVVSHEQNETMTDPLGTGWFDSSGYENGDECAWLPVATSWNGYGDYDQTINANAYLLQMEWSNRADACVARNSYPQPSASFTVSSNPTAGSPVLFTATAGDADDTIFTYRWSFGDGKSSTSPSPTHTFAGAGSYRVSLVVFDAHGDQKLVKKTVSVA
jgi:hypothetical protein